MTFSAVILDWRGTLVTTLSWRAWVEEGLRLAGREHSAAHVEQVLQALEAVDPGEARLDAPGVDCDAELHRRTYFGVFADAGLDPEVARALYAVESDHRHNRFAGDVAGALQRLRNAGVRVAVLSDVHFDIRPAFTEAGLGGLVDAFVLSFEQGAQKPDPAVFTAALHALGAAAEDTLMVGDRSGPDGAAVECGITTLLLPPLRSVDDHRLERVLALCGCR
ncbi:FMN phosphatase YigB (HAD superfamily) [Kineococcus xinjiangensis]|uniref:FMN phosphatase YigB (HAD superfamily) n=1 Tax=Kineococcus xinjiangensis TaxID=512762 RepID=A0A2S6IU43_9ACTN|nr:HAD family hydrolase [Kineococcus xinjiangensis]PPK97738.1 FMN phosphatase YigB (HAD superfamily) [Kineococcus xinjiangensis]